ncbi:hypothetical protein [Nocardia sp. IFM 10818]
MVSPEPQHPLERIDDPAQRRRIAEALARLDPDLDFYPRPQPVTERLVPVVNDGGRLGRAVTPHLPAVVRAYQRMRRWAPAWAATGTLTASCALVDVPAPVTVYEVGLTGFAFWHCCGRPGPIEALQRLRDGLHARAPSTDPPPPADPSCSR